MSNILHRATDCLSPLRRADFVGAKYGGNSLVRVPEYLYSVLHSKTGRKAAKATVVMLGCLLLFGCAELNGKTQHWVRDDCINYDVAQDTRLCLDDNFAVVRIEY